MGFDDGRIVLDSPNGAYYPGQTLFGRLEFDQDHVKTFRGIYVKIKGFCKIHWTTEHTRREEDREISYTVNHESYEEYIDIKIFLAGGKDGEHQLQPGHHVFPFQCHIPQNCPPSFEGEYGHIRYQVKVVVDRAFKLDQEKMATFRIIAPLDLNTVPNCKEPIQMEMINTFCCWCINSGSAQTLVKLPVSGFCPGQRMPIEVSCTNSSNVEIDTIKFVMNKKIIYHAADKPDTREVSTILMTMKKGPVPGNTTRNWTVDLDVPAMDVLNMAGCQYIDVEHLLTVNIETSGCHEDTEEYHPIIIGSIPIIGFQDDVQNPMQDQMPQPIGMSNNFQGVQSYPPVITTQPTPGMSPYPVHSPYPGNNYPANIPPYQGGSPAYPGANSPYSAPNPGYQGTNVPYPGANSPYPGANPPYPGANSQYPGANSPHPGATSPYPGSPVTNQGGSPYPSNTPYSGGPPVVAVPYPAGSPNQQITGTTLVKTGTFGFTVQGSDKDNEAAIPLLPAGGAVPYPPSAGNPYATASAPTPSTPDNENKKPSDTPTAGITSNPPSYNPDFH